MKKRLLFLLVFVFIFSMPIVVRAATEAPEIEWSKILGGSGSEDILRSIQQTSDGGYIVAGWTDSNNGDVIGYHGGRDYLVVKLDISGEISWSKCLGGSSDDVLLSIQQTSDGGYIVSGYSMSGDGDVTGHHSGSDYWVVKLDGSGEIEWQKCLGGNGSEGAFSIEQTTDGGYIMSGYSSSNSDDVTGNHGGYDGWVVKLYGNGEIEWQNCLGGSGYDNATNIRQTSDGGYIVAGISSSSNGDVTGNQGSFDYWIVKLDSSGEISWKKSLGGSDEDILLSIQQTSDEGYIVAGFSSSTDGDVTGNHGYSDYWVVKLDNDGEISWQKCLGGSGSEGIYSFTGERYGLSQGALYLGGEYSIQQTTDGGYIFAGYSNSTDGDVTGNHGGFDYWVVKIGSVGEIEWQKCLGGTSYDNATSIRQTGDGGYIVAGFSNSTNGNVTGNHGGYDFWIAKLYSETEIDNYAFDGFFRPIDMDGIVNVVKAGSAIPIKFTLGGDMGLDIFAEGYPKSFRVAGFEVGSEFDNIEEIITTGNSGLSYDPVTGQYTYVWQTNKSWSGTCRQLSIEFADGTEAPLVNFRFNK